MKFGGDFPSGIEPLQELSGPVRSRFALAIHTWEDFHGFQKKKVIYLKVFTFNSLQGKLSLRISCSDVKLLLTRY